MKGVKGKTWPLMSLMSPARSAKSEYACLVRAGGANGKYNGNDPVSGMQR
jgi:hypothetical protein